MKNKTLILVLLTSFLLAVSTAFIIFFDRGDKEPIKPPSPTAKGLFHIEATAADSAGVDSNTRFTIYSRMELDESSIQNLIRFEPPIDFSIKKIAQSRIAPTALATRIEIPLSPRAEIIPSSKLQENKIYRVVIDEGEMSQYSYSWAFQVKAPFQIIEIHPRNQATHVPTDTAIEITFNREKILNPQNFFEISPSIQGTFDQHGNTIVFLPTKLEEKSIYEVVVRGGLGAGDTDDTLDGDFKFVFETSEKRYGERPYFSFQGEFLEYVPDTKPVFQVSYWQMEPETLDVSVYKFNSDDEFMSSYAKNRRWDYSWSYFYRQNTGSLYEPREANKVISFKPTIIKSGYQTFIEIPQALSEGYYLLDVEFQGKREQAWLQISKAAHYFSITHDTSLLWLYDFTVKEPLKNVRVSYFDPLSKSPAREAGLGSTNNEGLLDFKTPVALQQNSGESENSPRFLKIVYKDDFPVFIKLTDEWGYDSKISKGDEYWDYLSTDRLTYQMNDSIKYWGVVKGRDKDIRQQKVEVGLYSGYYYYYDFGYDGYYGLSSQGPEALVKQEVLISQFDTIQGELAFRGVSPGYYSIIVKIGDRVVSRSEVEVLTYTKPAYQITVTPSKQAMFAGESATFNVSARFFDGTPVSKLKLSYSGYWQISISGIIDLDENGEGSFSYIPKYIEDYYPRDLTIRFSPKLSEEGDITGAGNVLVFGPNIYLQSWSERSGDDNFTFSAKMNHIVISNDEVSSSWRNEYIGGPVANYPISAEIHKITYTKVETGQYYDPINKIVRKTYDYRRNERIIENIPGTSNSNGEWSFTRNLPKEEGAYYEIIFNGKDPKGRNIRSSSYGSFYSYYDSWKEFSIGLSIQGESLNKGFSFGENVELELKVTEGELPQNAKVLFYRFKQNIDKAVVRPELTWSEIFNKEFLPSVQYRAVVLSPFGFEESNTVTAEFREKDHNLDITIKPDKEKYRPSEKIKLELEVKDKTNNPVSGEVNVSVVDESLFHILPYDWQKEILSTLYMNLYTRPISNASEYVSMDMIKSLEAPGGAEGGGCFTAGTPVLMKGGTIKSIETIKVGDEVLTLRDADSRELLPGIVQGISTHLVNEYLLINNSLEVTPEHKLFVNDKWEYAGNVKLGDKLVNASGKPQVVYSIVKKTAPNTRVYNIVVDKYHTYFAGGYWVHNQEKSGGTRSNFVDVAFFETVHTDEMGKASVEFVSPDNITAWRVTARAFEPKELKAGEKIELVKTSLPFFVDATMATTYLVGDEPLIRLRAFGDEHDPSKETDFVIIGGGDRPYKESGKGAVYIPIPIFPYEGEGHLLIEAEQGELKDSLLRGINIVKSYFRKSESSTYTVSENLTGIRGNKDGFTKLVFMDAGRGKFYQTLRWHTYLGGIRADQIAAQYFSEKLLQEHFFEGELPEPLDLSNYHTPEGGISLFPYSDSDIEVTAKMADLAPDFIFKSNVKDYLNKSLTDKKSDIHRIAKALYGLASLNEPVLIKINSIKDNGEFDFEDEIYIALALSKLGDKEGARLIYENDVRPALRFQGKEAWLYNELDITRRVKLTATVALLSSYLNIKEDSFALWNYIDTHDPERDLDILEETMFIKSELKNLPKVKAGFSYKTQISEGNVSLEKGQTSGLALFEDSLQSLRFSNIEGDIMAVSYYERSVEPTELTRNNEISLTRKYLAPSISPSYETNVFNEGDIIMVRLDPNIAQSAIDGAYQVIDYLPSGLRPITRTYDRGLSYGTTCDPVWYPAKIVDNIVYFNIYKDFDKSSRCANRTINYYARVVSKGKYNANPAIIQSLKDLNSLNISSEDKVEIR